jgi:hypothetical protein
LGLAEEVYFYIDDTDLKLKSGHHPLFIPDIPSFSPIRRLYEPEANFPFFPCLSIRQHRRTGLKSNFQSEKKACLV